MGDLDPELVHPEVAGWVLGTVDPDDAEWLAGHLSSCPGCRAAVAEFGPTAQLLVTAAPADLAPPGLQARILARVARAASAAPRNLHQATPLSRRAGPTWMAAWPAVAPRPIAGHGGLARSGGLSLPEVANQRP